ncbi:hypothetical protein [Deinococcus ruber]|uniref:Uncharacterized protein n=1 Tax=Deinococcus ruber TaxID=1848197 RepID=A0A918FHV7_9DEIO|nr:hypothetical protein [Deinococcus ruber]GGR36463.1 hypothetical protein GCM10008957_52650 [Deinococcus ruber]
MKQTQVYVVHVPVSELPGEAPQAYEAAAQRGEIQLLSSDPEQSVLLATTLESAHLILRHGQQAGSGPVHARLENALLLEPQSETDHQIIALFHQRQLPMLSNDGIPADPAARGPVLLLCAFAPVTPLTCVYEGMHHWPAMGEWINSAYIELYATADRRRGLCVLCDGPWNDGTSTINGAEVLVNTLIRTLLAEQLPDAVIHYLDAQTVPMTRLEVPRYAWLSFRDPDGVRFPVWTYAAHTEVEALIGTSAHRQHHAPEDSQRTSYPSLRSRSLPDD